MPVINKFNQQGKIQVVVGGGRSIEEVFCDTSKCIKDCIEKEARFVMYSIR